MNKRMEILAAIVALESHKHQAANAGPGQPASKKYDVLAPGKAWERGMRCKKQLGNLSTESCG
jgi:hypothetical protein